MAARMGRLTKRNRAKYRRRAYAVGMGIKDERAERMMRGSAREVPRQPGPFPVLPVSARRGDDPHGAGDRRAA
jgi:hypothetical protein